MGQLNAVLVNILLLTSSMLKTKQHLNKTAFTLAKILLVFHPPILLYFQEWGTCLELKEEDLKLRCEELTN